MSAAPIGDVGHGGREDQFPRAEATAEVGGAGAGKHDGVEGPAVLGADEGVGAGVAEAHQDRREYITEPTLESQPRFGQWRDRQGPTGLRHPVDTNRAIVTWPPAPPPAAAP